MYSGDNKNLVRIMVEKLWNESENLKMLNAAKIVSFLTDIGVTAINRRVLNKLTSATSDSIKP